MNKDGTRDLICRFEIRKARFHPNDRIGILRFRDLAGKAFDGRNARKIRDRDEAEDFATVEDD